MIYPSTDALFRLFLIALGLGAGFCLLYDFLRITRVLMSVGRMAPPRLSLPLPQIADRLPAAGGGWCRLLINLEDLLYFLFCGTVTAVFLSAANHGQIRWIAFAGIGGAFLICRLTVSRLILSFAQTAAELLRFVLLWVLWIVLWPLKQLGCWICRIGCLVRRTFRCIWLPLYTQWVMRRCLRHVKKMFKLQKGGMHNGTK